MKNMEKEKNNNVIVQKGYAVLQALAKEIQGIKIQHLRSMERVYAIFPTKDEARSWLANLLMVIKMEQGQGIRTADNLDPDTKLDFLIKELYIKININDEDIAKRGWKFNDINKISSEEELDKKMEESLNEWQATSATAQKIHEELKNK